MNVSFRPSVFGLGLFALLCLPLAALAQTAPVESHVEQVSVDSGIHDNRRGLATAPVEVYSTVVEVAGAPWLRLRFSDAELGSKSYLTVTSLEDGAEQRLDARALAQWERTSAYFNGDAVEVKLFAAPGEAGLFARVDEVVVGDAPAAPRSQCGTSDDRVASSNPAAARIVSVGCTAWLIEGGLFVSAGHCLGSSANVVQFNVPPSLPNGTIQNPGPEDQYPVISSSIVRANGGIGNDWGVFRTQPNSQGQTALEAQGAFFNVVRDLSPATIRITGYGVDDSPPGSTGSRNAQNQTQQTNAGPNAGSSGTTLRYRADTEGGNSGSPVIDEATGNAVGVHTNGGCTSFGGSNSGTSTFNASFWNEIDGMMPVASFDPSPSVGLEPVVPQGATATASLTLSNSGNEDLTFDFLQFSRAAAPALAHLDLGKGELDPRQGSAPRRGLGGPDAFGYGWVDSNEPDGPVFDFVDISGTGTALNLSDDDGEFVPLPFTFEFYGSDKTQVGISSNGYLTFDASDSTPSDFTNDGIPDGATPNDLIAPFWDDLDPGDGVGQVYYRNLGDGRFVVQWENVPHFPGPGSGNNYTFQAILNDDGTILFQYESMDGDRTSASIGIENADGSIGLEVSSFAPYVEDGLAVLIGRVESFVTDVSPAAGSVPPGGSVTVDVTVSAAGLAPGSYTNVLAVSTNEPSTYTYPVRLEVTSAGGLSVLAEAQNPPVVLGPPGGAFFYDVALANGAGSAQSFDAWVVAVLPNGSLFGPVEGPRAVRLPAGATGQATLRANVPANAPPGAYTVLVRVGGFPDGVEAEGSFQFTKTGAARPGPMAAADWQASGLEALADAASSDAATSDAAASTALPEAVTLAAAFPNPFERRATLGFALPAPAPARLAVYDVLGRTVAVLVDGEVEAGHHAVGFDASGLAGGVYLVRLEAGGQVQTQRITLLN